MSYIITPDHLLGEVATICISLMQLFHFIRHYFEKNCEWELIHIVLFEVISSVFHLLFADNTDSAMYVSLLNGNVVNWVRFLEWFATTPVLLKTLFSLAITKTPNTHLSINEMLILLVTNQMMLICGFSASLVSHYSVMYWIFVAFSFAIYAHLLQRIYKATQEGLKSSVNEECKTELRYIQILYFCAWTSFPILWSLGPEGLGLVNIQTSNTVHCVLKLFSKNLFVFLCWRYRWVVIATIDEEEQERIRLATVPPKPLRIFILEGDTVVPVTLKELAAGFGAEVICLATMNQMWTHFRSLPPLDSTSTMIMVNLKAMSGNVESYITTIRLISNPEIPLVLYDEGPDRIDDKHVVVPEHIRALDGIYFINDINDEVALFDVFTPHFAVGATMIWKERAQQVVTATQAVAILTGDGMSHHCRMMHLWH